MTIIDTLKTRPDLVTALMTVAIRHQRNGIKRFIWRKHLWRVRDRGFMVTTDVKIRGRWIPGCCRWY